MLLQWPQDRSMCKWVFFFLLLFSSRIFFKVLHNLHRTNLFHILIISCVRRKIMGLSCYTVNVSANIISIVYTACAGSDLFRLGFLKRTNFLVQGVYQLDSICSIFLIALITTIICWDNPSIGGVSQVSWILVQICISQADREIL